MGVLTVVGASGHISTSANHGVSWTARTPVTSKGLRGISSKPDATQAVAVGDQGAVNTTADQGVTWVNQTGPTATDYLAAVAWNGTRWVAVGYDTVTTGGGYASARSWTSTDGVTWTAATVASTALHNIYARSVVNFGGTFYATVSDATASSNSAGVYTSTNGTTWTVSTGFSAAAPSVNQTTGDFQYMPFAIASNGTRLMVAASVFTGICAWFTSTTGTTWGPAGTVGGFGPTGIAGTSTGGWVTAGFYSDAQARYTATNDFTGAAAVNPGATSGAQLSGICWEGTLYAASCNDGKVYTSTTGASWTQRDPSDASLTGGIGIIPNSPPTAATGLLPAAGSYADFTASNAFSWTFNDPDLPLDQQKSYALKFQRTLPTAGAAEWWDGANMQASETYVTSTTNGATVTANKIGSNGETYAWSVITKDQLGTAGVYSATQLITGSLPPTATLTAPGTTTSDTTRPPITWTYSDPESAVQESYIARYFDAATYGAVGFDPATSTATWDSGQVFSSAVTVTPDVDLTNGTTYRAYLLVYQTGGQAASSWQYAPTTITLDPIGTPDVIVSPDPSNGRIICTVQGHDNQLSADQAGAETGGSVWTAGSNTTVAQSGTVYRFGTKSWRLTATATGDVSMSTSGILARAGKLYTNQASFLSSTTPRSASVTIGFFDVGGVQIGASTTGDAITTTTGSWSLAFVSATAPVGAVSYKITVTVSAASASEIHYVDAISAAPGDLSSWARGGLTETTATVEVSDDGGVSWATLRAGTQTNTTLEDQALTFYDYEAVSGQSRIYRGKITAEIPSTISSAYSVQRSVTLNLDVPWLTHPTDSTLAAGLGVRQPYTFDTGFGGVTFDPVGSSVYDVLDDTAKGEQFNLNLETTTQAAYDLLLSVLQSKSTLLYRDPMGRAHWVRVTGKVSKSLKVGTQRWWTWTVPFAEVATP